MKLFTVHDKATNSYSAPVAIPSERDAVESFRLSANDHKSAHYKHAPDFTLIEIASYDQFTGLISVLADKKIIVNASALLNIGEQNGNDGNNN